MYSVKIKTNMRGFDAELSFSHDDPDIFYRKMFSLFEWANNRDKRQTVGDQFRFSSDSTDIITGTKHCPMHGSIMKKSVHNRGFWYCSAKDDQGRNGHCDIQIKMTDQEMKLFYED